MINFLYSLIQFVIALFFILVGIVGMMIPWSSAVRTKLVQFIQNDALAISLFSFAFLIIGTALATYIIMNSKRRYYHIRSDKYTVKVNEAIIEQYVSSYWKQLFPNRDIPSHIVLKKNKIQITADLPYLPMDQQQNLLERIKADLETLFKQQLGAKSEFNLFASFQAKPDRVEKE